MQKNLCPRLVFASGFVLLFVLSAAAQEWTRFRGPNGTGVCDTASIPAQWTIADCQWKITLPGKGHSSPVVWGDKVFLLSADADTAQRHVICVDAGSGRTVWQRTYPSTTHRLHPRNTFASSTPAVDQDHVYAAWAEPEHLTLRAFSHDGREVWMQDLGPYPSQHGFGSSPIVYEDLVILFNEQQGQELAAGESPGESAMLAFDRMSGELRWRAPRTTTRVCYSTPCIYRPQEGPPELIACNTGDGIFSLDPQTGAPNWSLKVFEMRTVSSPVVVGDLVLASNGSGGGGNYLVAVRAGEKPEEAYRVKRQAPYVATAVARGDLVFLFYDRGVVSCIEAATGNPLWQQRLASGFSGSPVLVDGKLYCIDEEGNVLVLAAEREFQELGRNPLGEPSRATPAVSGGRMFLRTESHLSCIGAGRS